MVIIPIIDDSKAKRLPQGVKTGFSDRLLGFASAVLFDGSNVTPELSGLVALETSVGLNEYSFRLTRSGRDQLFFAEEKVRYSGIAFGSINPNWKDLGFGHANSRLSELASSDTTIGAIEALLKKIFVYQFHDTSQAAQIRSSWSVTDGRYLKENAGTLEVSCCISSKIIPTTTRASSNTFNLCSLSLTLLTCEKIGDASCWNGGKKVQISYSLPGRQAMGCCA